MSAFLRYAERMARTPSSTATETPEAETTGTRHRKGRRASAHKRSYKRAPKTTGTPSGIATGDRYLNTFNTIVGALRSLNNAQRPLMLKACSDFVAHDWGTSAQTTNTIPTEAPLQGQQAYAAGAR